MFKYKLLKGKDKKDNMRKKGLMLIVIFIICLSGCGVEQTDYSGDSMALNQLADYLYELDCVQPYNYENAAEDFEVFMPDFGASSSISIGNLRGRNYDWKYDYSAEWVLHVPAIEGKRHASVGISNLFAVDGSTEDSSVEQLYDMAMYSTIDGINDAGLCATSNVTNFGEFGPWTMKTPEDTSDDRCELALLRYILDEAETLTDAVDIVNRYDWFSLNNESELHYMVTGKRSATDSTVSGCIRMDSCGRP